MAEQVTKGMSVSRVLTASPLAREVLKRHGIRFIGKQLSPLESLETVGKGNGLTGEQVDAIVREINDGLGKGDGLERGELVKLTPTAERELADLVATKRKKGIRLRLASDGCGLYTYDMDLGTKRLDGEVQFQTGKVTFYLERKTLPFLKGTTIDFHDGGFEMRNPNVA